MSTPEQPTTPGLPSAPPPPGVPYAQPGQQQYAPPYTQPGSPYATPAYPHAPASAAPRSNASALGRIALVAAALAIGISLLLSLTTPFIYTFGDYTLVDGLMNLGNILILLVAGAALVLGVLALRRPGPRLLAAIAIGISGTVLLGRVAGGASMLFYYF